MFTMRILSFCSLGVMSIALFLTSNAGASVIGDVQSGFSQFEDDDFELLVNGGGTIASPGADTMIDVGDFLVGMLRITTYYQPPGTAIGSYGVTENAFTAIFALKVTSTTAVTIGGRPIQFTAASDAEWGTLGLKALGYDPVFDGTAAIIYDDPDNISFGATASASLATVGGTPLWEFGFDGDADLFWGASGPADVSTALLVAPGETIGSFNAALNVTHTYAGGSTVSFLTQAVDDLVFGGGVIDGDDKAQIRISGAIISPIPAAVTAGFDIDSDADIFAVTNVVPEPTSVIMWSTLGLFGMVFTRRRVAV